MASSAVRFIRGTDISQAGSLQLRLRIKPGVDKTREGVLSVGEDVVEICVAAQPRNGEANTAVVRVLSEVLGVPKSRLRLSHGSKAREKTVVLDGVDGDDEDYAGNILALLRDKSRS